MSWDDPANVARRTVIAKRWASGESTRQIAEALDVTRNVVVGVLYRMRMRGGEDAPKTRPVRDRMIERSSDRKRAIDRKKRTLPASAKRPFTLKPLPFIDRRMGLDCAWIYGDPRCHPVMCCGWGVRNGSQYCPEHFSLAYQRSGEAA